MKIVLLLSALSLPFATSSSLRRIQTTQCLTGGVDQITFQSTCSQESVEANVEAALVGTGCVHSALDEIKILSGNTHSWQAKQFLVDHCNTLEFDPCLGDLDSITFRGICDHTSVYEDLEAALLNDGACVHGVDKELKLLANNNHDWHAKNVLVAHCKALDHDSCLDKTAITFTSACSTDSVVDDVEDALVALGTCAHEAEREVELLTDITGNSWQAKVALTTLCKSQEHDSCLDKDAMTFTSACSTDSVKQDVATALAAISCGHDTDREIALLTGEQNAWTSKVALSNHCKTLDFHPCLDKATMSFTSTCSTDSVKQDVETALTGFGCAHGTDREIVLLTDEPNGWKSKVALATHCESLEHGACLDKTQIEFSTACSTDSVYVDVQSALTTLGTCAHEVDREIELLAGKTNNWQAKVELSSFCKTLEHDSCLELATMTFTSTCSTESVKQDVENALTGSGCAHDADREIMLLTDDLGDNLTGWTAKVALATHCEGLAHGSCLDKATIDFTSACSTDSVVDDVGKALTTLGTCAHDASREVELLAGVSNNWNARVEMSGFCKTLDHEPCLTKTTIPFASTCTPDSVEQDVTSALAGVTCAHETTREMELLTDKSSSWDAKVALKDFCRTLEHDACLDLKTLVFPNCEDDTFVSVIDTALAAASCPHDIQMELFIHTDIANSWESKREVINTVCVQSLTPCLRVEDLLIFNCDRGLITDVVTAALPATCTHDVEQEIELLGNNTHSWQASVAISEECHTYIQPCTSPTPQDYIVDNCKNPLNVVKELLANTNCLTHDKHTMEIIALTGKPDTTSAVDHLKAECIASRVSCTRESWDGTMVNGCDWSSFVEHVKDQMELPDVTCYHKWETEIELLTGSAVGDQEAAKTFITTMCDSAWTGVTTSKFTDISETVKPPVFTDAFLDEYTMGDTFLNTETGNFQGPENPAYPDSQMDPRTRGIGSDIDYYLNGEDDGDRNGVGATTILESFTALESCPTAILCCFGRDRQSKDNNGDCAQNDCANKGPADNSNLCFVEEPEFMAYPNADEGSIHCHGLTWSEDINDFSQRLRFNNFFFVSLYDHMYSRGYVEPMIEDNQVLPMCDCIEEMPPVVRSDCTQLDVELNFAVNTDANGLLTAVTEDDMKIAFNACRGNPNNDLAAYAKKLHQHNEISEGTYETILDTIIGEIGGGNDQEGVCEAAVESY